MSRLASVVLVTACLAAGMVSCDDGGTGVEGTGSIEVTLNMTGSDLDPDGGTVSVDGLVERTIEAGGSVTFADLEVGFHGVHLYDLSGNCVVGGENPRAVSVAAGETSEAAFEVTCAALTGSVVVVTLTSGDSLDADGYTVTLDGVTSQAIGTDDVGMFSDLAAGSHSVELSDVAANCWVEGLNPRTVSVSGAVTTHTVFLVACRAAPSEQIAFTSDRDGNLEIYVMDAYGPNPVRLTDNPASDYSPAWSPDGTRIAFVSYRDGNGEIYVMDADGSNPVRLTDEAAWDGDPAWSPDGTRIAFVSNRYGSGIFVMDADGSNQLELIMIDAEIHTAPDWSPDGTQIAFTAGAIPGKIYVMDADGSNLVNLTSGIISGINQAPAWSPDGTQIAFVNYDYENFEIYVMDADGSNPVRLTNDEASDGDPDWSPDGTQIIFRSGRDGNGEIYVMGANGSNPTNLTNNPNIDHSPAWWPGSQQR